MRFKVLNSLSAIFFVVGLVLVFWSLNLNLVGGAYALDTLHVLGKALRYISSAPDTTSLSATTDGVSITVFTIQKGLFVIAFVFGLMTSLQSLYVRYKFGKHRLFPATLIAGICLCYIAVERGYFIGVL